MYFYKYWLISCLVENRGASRGIVPSIIGVPLEAGHFGKHRMGSNLAESTSTVTTREPVLEGEEGDGRG